MTLGAVGGDAESRTFEPKSAEAIAATFCPHNSTVYPTRWFECGDCRQEKLAAAESRGAARGRREAMEEAAARFADFPRHEEWHVFAIATELRRLAFAEDTGEPAR